MLLYNLLDFKTIPKRKIYFCEINFMCKGTAHQAKYAQALYTLRKITCC
jgi:hypothetical protein